MNPSHRRAGWRHCKDGGRWLIAHPHNYHAERVKNGWAVVPEGGEFGASYTRYFSTWGEVYRARFGFVPGVFSQTIFGVDVARPGGDRTAIVTGREHGKRAEFSLYVDGHKVPGVTGISFGEHPFEGVDRPPVEPKPKLSPLEQLKADAKALFEQSNMYWANRGDEKRMAMGTTPGPGSYYDAFIDRKPFANMTTAAPDSPEYRLWSKPPEFTLEQLKADLAEIKRRFPPSGEETMFERVQREMGKVPFEPIPPAYFDESFDQVVTAEFERMKKLIWPKDDAEPEARMMLREAIVAELRRRRKLGIPDPKYLRAEPEEVGDE